jgi:hypothetical protein
MLRPCAILALRDLAVVTADGKTTGEFGELPVVLSQ